MQSLNACSGQLAVFIYQRQEKWKHTLLYLVFKAWVYVVQVKSKEEGRFIEMIKNMRGHTTKQWFERWVLFYQEQQKKKIKKNKEQAAIEQKLNLKKLELKSEILVFLK